MINLKKGQDSPSISDKFKEEFKPSRESLLNKLDFLRRQRDEILVPFIKMSIPDEILSAMSMYPKYFKTSRAVEVTNETRYLVTFINSPFPTEDDSIKIFVPAFIFDEIVGIDNCIEDILKSIAELKRLNQLSSCC